MRKETRDDVLAYVQGMATLLGVDININVTWNKEPIQIITYNPETDCAILSLSEQIFYATPHDFYRSISALIASVFDKKLQHLWSLFDEGKLKKQDLQEQAFKISRGNSPHFNGEMKARLGGEFFPNNMEYFPVFKSVLL